MAVLRLFGCKLHPFAVLAVLCCVVVCAVQGVMVYEPPPGARSESALHSLKLLSPSHTAVLCCAVCSDVLCVQGALVYEPPGARSESALRHMMSGGMRRWVLYEWLYPAIDRPWFMKNELQVSEPDVVGGSILDGVISYGQRPLGSQLEHTSSLHQSQRHPIPTSSDLPPPMPVRDHSISRMLAATRLNTAKEILQGRHD